MSEAFGGGVVRAKRARKRVFAPSSSVKVLHSTLLSFEAFCCLGAYYRGRWFESSARSPFFTVLDLITRITRVFICVFIRVSSRMV